VFLAGKRDIATLYEYWVFFHLLEVAKKKFNLDADSVREILDRNQNGLTLRLKAGRQLVLHGRWVQKGKSLRVRLSYNRVFSRVANPPGDEEMSFPNAGSWTRAMQPDYTISLWPEELSEKEAESADRIVHLHFDAKYRVEFSDLFGAGDEDEESEVHETPAGMAGRADLLKMHVYKDAIRRSVGAFVIYPGSESRRWRARTEMLPGLGAIALAPGQVDATATLSAFIDQAAELLSDGRISAPT
jgi:predicted component of viral defense system (DUF524 family)